MAENDIYSATNDPTDPQPPCGAPPTFTNTLWYSRTTGANAEYLSIVANGYSGGAVLTTIGVYTGSPGAFRFTGACGTYSQNPNNARIFGVRLEPNTEYSIEVGSAFGLNPMQPLSLTFSASPAFAVTKTADTADGVCNADCSLREAIGAANVAGGAVLIPAGTYTLTLVNPPNPEPPPATIPEDANAAGDLDVTAGMGIYGAGIDTTTIDANDIDRALDLRGASAVIGRTFLIGDLTISNGTTISDLNNQQPGGGLRATLDPNWDFVALDRVKVAGNTGFYGAGGAQIFGGRGFLRDCRFTDNTSGNSDGGGLYYVSQGLALDVVGCTFDDNTAFAYGGGIAALGSVRVVNSTISGNHAGFGGAGIDAGNFGIVLRSNTIVFNDVPNAGAPNAGAGVRFDTVNGSNTLSNNVIAGNTSLFGDDADCARVGSSTLVTSYNHVQRNNNCTLTGPGDVVTGDPLVNPLLANNGGLTPTHALDPASPAVDSGDLAGCKDQNSQLLACDQRGFGFPRRLGDACDKGAFEFRGSKIFRDGYEATGAVGTGCPDAASP